MELPLGFELRVGLKFRLGFWFGVRIRIRSMVWYGVGLWLGFEVELG